MASTINATTSSGIVATADNTGSLALQTSGTTAVTIDTSQNVGIGTTSPVGKLDVTGLVRLSTASPTFPTSGVGLEFYYDTPTDMGRLQSYSRNASAWKTCAIASSETRFETGGTERMRIDSSGNTMVGTTSPSGLLTVAGSYAQAGTVGLTNYTIDTTPTATVVANGASVDFTLLSGMLVVNSWGTGGVTIWLMGGGGTSAVSSIIGTVGTMSYVYPYYRWTNNSGSAQTFGFFCVRTRTGP